MIASKLEQIGDRLALVLDADAASALNAQVGDTVYLELPSEGVVRISLQETWVEDPHARGRVFLKRYRRTFSQLG